jgi:hypothetical protein
LFSKLTVYDLDLDGRGSILYRDIDSSQHLTQGVTRAVFLQVGGGDWGWKRCKQNSDLPHTVSGEVTNGCSIIYMKYWLSDLAYGAHVFLSNGVMT